MFPLNRKATVSLVSASILLGVAWIVRDNSTIRLPENEVAVVFRFGEIINVLKAPGTYHTFPLIENFKLIPSQYPLSISTTEGANQVLSVHLIEARKFFAHYNGDYKLLKLRLQELIRSHLRSGQSLGNFIRKYNRINTPESGVRLELI